MCVIQSHHEQKNVCESVCMYIIHYFIYIYMFYMYIAEIQKNAHSAANGVITAMHRDQDESEGTNVTGNFMLDILIVE